MTRVAGRRLRAGTATLAVPSAHTRARPTMRKAKQVEKAKAAGAFATARCLSASLGYSSIKPYHLPDRIAVVLWLPEASSSSTRDDLAKLYRAAHRMVMPAEKDSVPAPDAVFIIDCTPLVPTGSSARGVMDKEVSQTGADAHLGKTISKPVSRILEKLLAGYKGSVTLVGIASGAPLALCLHEQLHTERVALVKPYISPATVNALLIAPSKAPPVVDVLYESAKDSQRRDGALRHAYPNGASHVLDSHVAIGTATSTALLSDPGSSQELARLELALATEPDAESQIDSAGRTVWWSEWTFELNRHTKQPEAAVNDFDPWAVVSKGKGKAPAAPPARESTSSPCPTHGSDCSSHGRCSAGHGSPSGSGVSDGQDRSEQQEPFGYAGALILRGNRCVLVRSLEDPPEWMGMRIPMVEVHKGDGCGGSSTIDGEGIDGEGIAGAVRECVEEQCDIEDMDAELQQLPSVPPAALHLRDEKGGRALIYPLYAMHAPRGMLEDADVEDEEDSYDWYTWPRAVNALRHDPHAIATLRTIACGIAAAINSGAVASKWGGYFGQEWIEGGVPPTITPLPASSQMARRQPAAESPETTRRLAYLEATVEQILQRLPNDSSAPPLSVAEASAGGNTPVSSATAATDAGMLDVIVVGAGAAGVGCASMLTNTFGLDPSRVLLIERGEAVGETFRRWPAEMRFISPSFNSQGWTSSFDLNSVAYNTSPAFSLHTQHPSGSQYADYLAGLAETAKLNVRTRTDVSRVVPVEGGGFEVHVRPAGAGCEAGCAAGCDAGGATDLIDRLRGSAADVTDGSPREEEVLRARYVVWAAGEFQYPRVGGSGAIAGAELCTHNSRVKSWAKLPGDDFVLIGGYESGADAAINLAKAGKQATVLASTATWHVQSADPSAELAPYTAARLREVTAPGFSPKPKLLAPLRVLRVEKAATGGFDVIATWKAAEELTQSKLRKPVVGAEADEDTATTAGADGDELVLHTAQPPVLCTGFHGSVASAASHLFNLESSDAAKGCLAGAPLLSSHDESTKVPGVFLVGPTVRHGELSFCFIYKFRQRFAIVANQICRGLGRDTEAAVSECRKMNMFMDDMSCCESTCGETC